MTDGRPPPMFWTTIVPGSGAGQDEAALRRSFGSFEISREAMFLASVNEILKRDLGYGMSLGAEASMLGDGRPIPLMFYGLVEYLLSLDLSEMTVLELGGGQSTLFWSKKAKSVRTVEHDLGWIERISQGDIANVEIVEVRPEEYVERVQALEGEYDVIVIDCAANRYECARAAGGRLREGGMIILDNSDWYPNTAEYLRGLDLIQVDFPDFRPSHHYRCTTSLFLHPAFRPRPAGKRLPPPALGGKDVAATNGWDMPAS